MATVGVSGVLASTAMVSFNNVFSLNRTNSDGFDGDLTAKELGISYLLAHASSKIIWNMIIKDPAERNELFRLEDDLKNQVEELRSRDASTSISVPRPPRKKGWTTCIARAQDLGRSSGGIATYGWGWGLSKDFQTAKNGAVQMANTSIGAVDTHHTQWRCVDHKGNIRRP